MTAVKREAVRVLCVDASGRVLLLRWRDPHDGSIIWEPPGGGVEAGESFSQAALRELAEETGLVPERLGNSVKVHCDVWWNGQHNVGDETYFIAAFSQDTPAVTRDGLLDYEAATLLEHRWVAPAQASRLIGRLQPPDLAAVLARLGYPAQL